jgi:hypothetical protein
MLQALLVKTVVNQVMKAIEKASDKRIASGHEKRIAKLEKMAHEPADFICTECGCKAKRKSNNKRRK